jgi:hypothetical protein
MTDDEEMALRIFNYSYLEGLKTKKLEGTKMKVKLTPAIVIYLESTDATPNELSLEVTGLNDVVRTFTFPTMKFLDYSIGELEERNLSLLLPFYLLKLRKRIKAMESSEERLAISGEMKKLVEELIETIERSERKGLMTKADMRQIIGLMGRLYNDLYKLYPEFKETNMMVDEMLLTVVDEAELAGKKKGKIEVAQKLISMGLTGEQIVEATQLDLSTVESLYGLPPERWTSG